MLIVNIRLCFQVISRATKTPHRTSGMAHFDISSLIVNTCKRIFIGFNAELTDLMYIFILIEKRLCSLLMRSYPFVFDT